MTDNAPINLNSIPSFLGLPVGDLEDLVPNQVAIAGYFCDNLDRPAAGQRYLARQLRYASIAQDAPVNAIDLGDLNVFPLEPTKHSSAVACQCEAVLKTGARMILVGGDRSGLKALTTAAKKTIGTDAIILSVDLQQLAATWVSQPHRLAGLSPAQIITQINNTLGNVVAAAVFGLAPALDNRGSTETKAALAILQAVTVRLNKGAQ